VEGAASVSSPIVGAYRGNPYLLWEVAKPGGEKNNISARKHFQEILSDRSPPQVKRRRSIKLDYPEVDCVRSGFRGGSVVTKLW